MDSYRTSGPSRRALLSAAFAAPGSALARSDFDLWSAELDRVLAALEATPEADEARRDELHDRWQELENLILHTPGSTHSAAQAKAQLLWKLSDMERHENTAAMRDVRDFVLRRT